MERTFFITSVTAQRKTLFQTAAAADLLLDVFLHYRAQGKYRLHDLVIMPDHFHALITPANRNLSGTRRSIHQRRILVSTEVALPSLAGQLYESSDPRRRGF
jgi:REP element-mobilizing transposase RayT